MVGAKSRERWCPVGTAGVKLSQPSKNAPSSPSSEAISRMPFGARRAWRLAGGLLVTGGQCPAGLAAWRGRQRLTARVYARKGACEHARRLTSKEKWTYGNFQVA